MDKVIEKNNTNNIAKEWPSYFNNITEDLKTLEINLSEKLTKKEGLLSSLISHIFKAGGKRIRPAMGFLIAKGTGSVSEKHMTLGELTELIHTASLIHDDIIDSANFRRGKETINNLWNDKVSVISGDFLFAQASVRLGILENTEIVKIYAHVLSDLCEGEIDQFTKKYDTSISWDYYITKSKSKTASLFAAVCKSSAIINKLDDETIEKANNFGEYTGIAFQIVDDILDFTNTKEDLGKDVCSDLKQGLITAPTLYALEAKNEQSQMLEKLITSRFGNNDDSFKKAINLVFELNGIEKAKDLAKDYISKANANLSIIQDEKIKTDLKEITSSILKKIK